MDFAFSAEKGASWFWASGNRIKYQLESTNVSMVSVSRLAGPAHLGHGVFTQSSRASSGFPVFLSAQWSSTSGRRTGSCSSGTGTAPHESQWTMGMGVPQYRWRLMSQSRRRHFSTGCARPAVSSMDTSISPASLDDLPLYKPLCSVRMPWSIKGSFAMAVVDSSSEAASTNLTGSS